MTLLLLIITVFFSFTIIKGSPSSAKEPKKVAILPFTMNADRDLTFLQEGIMDMLASRLAWKGEVEILEKGKVKKKVEEIGRPLTKERALLVGKALQADYVILGSLTVFGESVSIDAKIMDIAKSEALMTAFNQSKGMDEVIPTVNQFAEDINEKIMGRVVARRPAYTMAPEVPRGPGGLIAPGESFQGKGLGHVQAFRVEITGLDVGDVDGDGKNELVFIDKDTVYLYKWAEKGFVRFKTLKGRWGPNYVWVSVADLDGNGRAEIYVSNPSGPGLSSLVLEWQGNRFVELARNQGWFFRVMDMSGQGSGLVGQKRAIDGSFMGDVQYLKRAGKDFVSTGSLKLPRHGNVFNFVQADLAGDGKTFTVILDPYERLVLYNNHGEEIWRSEEHFGGSLTYMENKGGDATMTDTGKYVFFSSPIFLTDVDEDGQQEVMICRNRSRSGRLFGRMRDFTSGTVHFLAWDKVGLSTKWRSKKLTGPVVAYKIADVDHDGLNELVIASVTKERGVARRPRSQVVVYDLK